MFQDGPAIALQSAGQVPDVKTSRDGKLTADDTRLAGITLELRDGVTGQPILGSMALAGAYPANQPITATTDQTGDYAFVGLPPGIYAVYDVQPAGYLPGIDTPGSAGGLLDSKLTVADPATLGSLVDPPQDDAILNIALAAGGNSTMNNFSVVATSYTPPTSNIQPFVFPAQSVSPQPVLPVLYVAAVALPVAPPVVTNPLLLTPVLPLTGSNLFTWHLSVVDAGQPRTALWPSRPFSSRRCGPTTIPGTLAASTKASGSCRARTARRLAGDSDCGVAFRSRAISMAMARPRSACSATAMVCRSERQRSLGCWRLVGPAWPQGRSARHRRLGWRWQDRYRHLWTRMGGRSESDRP